MTEIIEELLERFLGTIFSFFAAVRSNWNDLERLERFAMKSMKSLDNSESECGTGNSLKCPFSTPFVPLLSLGGMGGFS
jgi:hypothetical protein